MNAVPTTKPRGRPRKYLTDVERKAAKTRQTVEGQRRRNYESQAEQQRNNKYKNQRNYHRHTGYASQKAWRQRKKEAERLIQLAQLSPTPPPIPLPNPPNAAPIPIVTPPNPPIDPAPLQNSASIQAP